MAALPHLGDFARALLALESDPAFLHLAASQNRTNLFRILGTDERERWHSAFWAWLLDPSGTHGLGDLPIRRILVRAFDGTAGRMRARLLVPALDTDDAIRWTIGAEDGARALSLGDVLALRVRSAIAAPGPLTGFSEITSRAAAPTYGTVMARRSGDDARFDIVVMLEAPHPRHPEMGPLTLLVVIEVKVNAPYDARQLERYSTWLHAAPSPGDLLPSTSNAAFIDRAQAMVEEAAKGDPAPGIWCIGLFLSRSEVQHLTPSAPETLAIPWSTITFEHLIEDVIEPALRHPDLDSHARPLLQAYIDLSAHPSTKVLNMPPSEHRELALQLLERHPDTFRIIASVLQKFVQDEEVNQAGATLAAELDAPTGNRDYTKYDVRVGEVLYARQSKRNAMYRVLRGVVDEGASVATLATQADLKWAFLGLEGTLDRAAFTQRAVESRRTFDPSRWFVEDEQIVHQDGRSWVLTNQWGGNVTEVMRRFVQSVPNSKVRVDPARP